MTTQRAVPDALLEDSCGANKEPTMTPDQLRLVPVEPTDDMSHAGCNAIIEVAPPACCDSKIVDHVYRAMVAAAPDAHAAAMEENAKLAARVRELESDLSWLEQHDGRFYNIDKISSIVGRGFNGLPSLRSAIDAARSK